jgi:hypothetical protein
LYCQEDASSECIHVGFCPSLPQVFKGPIKMRNNLEEVNKVYGAKFKIDFSGLGSFRVPEEAID